MLGSKEIVADKMEIFPSNNKKVITTGRIVSFSFGAILGFFVGAKITDTNILLSALATLVAAFLGAWTAYKLEDNKKQREYKEKCLESANNILFALYERTKALKVFQRDSINPHRDDPFKAISMMPLLDFSYPESNFNVETLLFMLCTKHSQLMLDLHTEKEFFNEAFKLIRFRSSLHFNHVQPAMESGGILEGGEYTRQQMIDTMGKRVFAQLERATDDVIKYVDRTIASSEKVKTRLVTALKELYPNEKVLNYEFEENAV